MFRDDKDSSSEDDHMKPVGWRTDIVGSTKSVLLGLLLSFSSALKVSSSELLWELSGCVSDEFVRLVGLGAGAGVLAEKGLISITE